MGLARRVTIRTSNRGQRIDSVFLAVLTGTALRPFTPNNKVTHLIDIWRNMAESVAKLPRVSRRISIRRDASSGERYLVNKHECHRVSLDIQQPAAKRQSRNGMQITENGPYQHHMTSQHKKSSYCSVDETRLLTMGSMLNIYFPDALFSGNMGYTRVAISQETSKHL